MKTIASSATAVSDKCIESTDTDQLCYTIYYLFLEWR